MKHRHTQAAKASHSLVLNSVAVGLLAIACGSDASDTAKGASAGGAAAIVNPAAGGDGTVGDLGGASSAQPNASGASSVLQLFGGTSSLGGGTSAAPVGGATSAGGSANVSGTRGAAGASSNPGSSGRFENRLSIVDEKYCAIDSQGRLVCWGDSAYANNAGPYTAISGSAGTTCLLLAGGDDKCLGYTAAHPGVDDFVSIKAAGNHVCAQRRDRSILCWGQDFDGSVSSVPTEPVDYYSTGYNTCVASAGAATQCWGGGGGSPPKTVLTNLQATESFTCGISADQKVYCWGSSTFESTTSGFVKAKMAAGSAGDWGCAQRTTNKLACWGSTSPVPAADIADLTIADFELTENGVCVIVSDGTVRCWGPSSDIKAVPADLRMF